LKNLERKRIFTHTAVIVIVLLLNACVGSENPKKTTPAVEVPFSAVKTDSKTTGVALYFSEQEEGNELFTTRIFINKYYMQMVDSRSPNDYLIFDRTSQTIYNVIHTDRTIFEIRPKKVVVSSPLKITYVEQSQPSAAIPRVQGKKATHYEYLANDQRCYSVVSLGKEFLPEVSRALGEFRNVLAGEHAATLGGMPKELLEPCDLALNIFHTTKHLTHGLPIREWDEKGYLRFLINYRDPFDIDARQLVVPQDYQSFSIDK